jgi:hypothetical protein
LTRDHYFAFLQIAFNNFSGRTIRKSHLDPTRLRLAILAQHPDQTCLTFKHRSTGWCEASFPLVIGGRSIRTTSSAVVLLPSTLSSATC